MRAQSRPSCARSLTGAGATAQFFTNHDLHGKVIVADGAAFVGSQKRVVDALAMQFASDEANPAP
jgi:hypothetical protein